MSTINTYSTVSLETDIIVQLLVYAHNDCWRINTHDTSETLMLQLENCLTEDEFGEIDLDALEHRRPINSTQRNVKSRRIGISIIEKMVTSMNSKLTATHFIAYPFSTSFRKEPYRTKQLMEARVLKATRLYSKKTIAFLLRQTLRSLKPQLTMSTRLYNEHLGELTTYNLFEIPR